MIGLTILIGVSVTTLISGQNNSCGVQVFKPHSHPGSLRIVGGQESVPHSWPWTVLLKFRSQEITCAGALVRGADGALVVVTAAHCVSSGQDNPADWVMIVGVHSRSAMEQYRKEYSVKEVIEYPGFDLMTFGDDIAIMKPSTAIQINDYVSPICLTSVDSGALVGKECVISGWGSEVVGGPPLDKLHEVYKPIIADNDCNNALGVYGYNTSSMLCAGDLLQGGVDACSYDSGVPFACKGSTGKWELVGMSSWGFGCAQPGYPGVYTEVYTFIQWIMDNTNPVTSSPVVG